jgi:SAM-dependent methyltransferase
MRGECLICAARGLSQVLDLGMHPFADRFVPADRAGEPDSIYPLVVDRCGDCGHAQLRTVTDPADRYADYTYTAGHSATMRAYWDEYAADAVQSLELAPGSVVVEAGSNDGYLCAAFQRAGMRACGIDPSQRMCDLAMAAGVESICGRLDLELAAAVRARVQPADLVVANNVLNHADDPIEFVRAAAHLLKPGGHFAFQVPDWHRMRASGNFDQVYLEHVSYFSAQSIGRLLRRVGLHPHRVCETPQHGGSLRIFASPLPPRVPSDWPPLSNPLSATRGKLLAAELEVRRRETIRQVLSIPREAGAPLVCAGASAKGNTWLNSHGFDHRVIDFVTDVSPLKVGRLTPGSRIPIRHEGTLSEYRRPRVIVTAWNLRESVEASVRQFNPNAEIVEVHP